MFYITLYLYLKEQKNDILFIRTHLRKITERDPTNLAYNKSRGTINSNDDRTVMLLGLDDL